MAEQSEKEKTPNRDVSTQVAGTGAGAPGRAPWLSRDQLGALVLVLAVIQAYQPVWRAGFIWDDDGHVTRPDLRSWEGLRRIWFELGATQQYYPVVHSVFWVEYRLWDGWPLGYHLVNIFLYALSTLLLLKILRQLEVPGAWLATAIFALHPVQVESVAWISELKNMLSGTFYFSSALAYLRFDRTRKTGAYAAALILFVLGLMSKSVIATLPAALLVVFWWKRGRLSWKREVAPLLPFFLAGMGSGLFTAWVERHFLRAEGADYNYTLIERCLIAGRAIWFYLGKLVWPRDLIFIYPRWEISETVWWQYLFPAAALVLAAALAWLSRRRRGPLAGYLFFVGTLFPALGFLNVYPFRYSFVADHFQYLACLGFIVPIAAGLARLADWAMPERPRLRIALGAVLLLVLGTLGWQRAWAYEDLETLWTNTLARNPDCWMAHNNLGLVLFQKGRVDEAMAQFQKAVEINPGFLEAQKNLGFILMEKGRVDEAISHYEKAVAISPDDAEIHDNLGNALLARGRVDEATAQFQEAVRLNPTDSNAQNNLAKAQAMTKPSR